MSEYVRKIAAEEFSSQIAHVFSANDSPFGHVDCERVVSAFRGAFQAEAGGRPLSAVPRHSMVPAMRRFLGPTSYERELADIICAAYPSALSADAFNAQLVVEGPTRATRQCVEGR